MTTRKTVREGFRQRAAERNARRQPSYRFHCRITDENTGAAVEFDFCSLTDIHADGSCESVDLHVASLLRAFNTKGRAQYEAKEYGGRDE